MAKRFPIHRTRIGKDIFAEFVIPPTAKLRKKGRVAIVARGVPAMPGGSTFLEFLAREGFYAISHRYRGTWESSGVFLKDDPTDDIEEVLNATRKPLVSLYEEEEYVFPQNPRTYLFGASFGGPACLLLSKDSRVTRIFAYAPVVDWRAPMLKEPVRGLARATKRLYGEAYRFDPKGETRLLSGKFYNPATAQEQIEGSKIHIFHAKDDDIVAYAPVEHFAQEVGAKFTSFTKGGHGGASSFMDPRVWKRILSDIGS